MAYAIDYDDAENNRIDRSYNSNGIYEYNGVYNKSDYCDKCGNGKMGIRGRGFIDFGVYWCESGV